MRQTRSVATKIHDGLGKNRERGLLSRFVPPHKSCFLKLKARKVISLPPSTLEFMPLTKVHHQMYQHVN